MQALALTPDNTPWTTPLRPADTKRRRAAAAHAAAPAAPPAPAPAPSRRGGRGPLCEPTSAAVAPSRPATEPRAPDASGAAPREACASPPRASEEAPARPGANQGESARRGSWVGVRALPARCGKKAGAREVGPRAVRLTRAARTGGAPVGRQAGRAGVPHSSGAVCGEDAQAARRPVASAAQRRSRTC